MIKIVIPALLITFCVLCFSFYELGKYDLIQELCNNKPQDFCEVSTWKLK